MICEKCGYRRAKYEKSRKALWKTYGKTRGKEERTDFRAVCPKCGHKWIAR